MLKSVIVAESFSKVLALISTPFIAKTLGVDMYGAAILLITVATYITPLIGFRVERAILISCNDQERFNSMAVAMLLISGSAILLYIVTIVIKKYTDFPILWIILASILLVVYNTILLLSYSLKIYKPIAQSVVIVSIVAVTTKIFLSLLYPTANLLIYALALSSIFGIFFLLSFTKGWFRIFLSMARQPKLLWHALISRKQYILYSTPTSLLHKARESGVIFLIGYFYGSAALGSFSLYHAVILAPTGILVSIIRKTYLVDQAKKGGTGQDPAISVKFLRLAPYILFVFLSGVFLLYFLVPMYLGSEWKIFYGQIIYSLVLAVIMIIEIPNTSKFILKGRQDLLFKVKLITLIIFSILMVTSAIGFNINIFLIFASVFQIVLYLVTKFFSGK